MTPCPAATIPHRFPVGAEVEAKQPNSLGWSRARVLRHEPYLGRPGYYVSYLDAKEQWDCHSGWQMEATVREPSVVP